MKEEGIDKGLIKIIDSDKPQFKGFLPLRKLFWKYLNLLNVPFTDTCCDGASTATPPPQMQVATVTLTDEQIKALPTTGIEVIAAPGAGKFIMPMNGYMVANLVGAYNGPSMVDASWGIMSNGKYLSSLFDAQNLGALTGEYIIPLLFPNSYQALGSGNLANLVITQSTGTVGELENKSVVIRDEYNGVSNYTGGNAANTLKVTVYYVIVDL